MNIVSTKLMGGLGNYMFQISAAYSVSVRDNKKLLCDYSDNMVPHKPFSHYTQNIFRKIEFSNGIGNHTPIGEPSFAYSPIPKVDGDVKLYGYFQSEKYFKHIRSEILFLFNLNQEIKEKISQKYSHISNEDSCSLHVRRGDYLGLSNFHPQQSIEYYTEATKVIGQDKLFVIFSDDIEWCKQNFDFLANKEFISGNEDYEDMFLMSSCQNNIITNSTFSWWGAWLNKNSNKKVVAPKKWFGPSNLHLDTKDLYCDEWAII